MATITYPILSHREAVVTGIYIARGDETLGPYNSLEAAALVVGGYLRADDYAARDGDPTWVPLAEFLPLSALTRAATPLPAPTSEVSTTRAHPHRWRRLTAALVVLLAAPLLVAGGIRWLAPRHMDDRSTRAAADASRAASLKVANTDPAVLGPTSDDSPKSSITLAAVMPELPVQPAAPVVDGPVTGSLSLTLAHGGTTSLPGVRVSAYPLAALEPSLSQKVAEAQAARARLDPQIADVAAKCATRKAEAEAALLALRAAAPSDPLLGSLRFASAGAKAAAKTAENDYRYLLDQRADVAGGGVFFRGLPDAVVTADANEQGRFALEIPAGDDPYVLAASWPETASDGSTRLHYWLVRLSPGQRSGNEAVQLDDTNVSSGSAAESLIHTAE